MKDICEITRLSRGGLYSHFDGTRSIFEALLERIHQKEKMDFSGQKASPKPAREILSAAIELMEEEMKHPICIPRCQDVELYHKGERTRDKSNHRLYLKSTG